MRNARYWFLYPPTARRTSAVVLPLGIGRLKASSVMAIATTASEKKISRSAAAASKDVVPASSSSSALASSRLPASDMAWDVTKPWPEMEQDRPAPLGCRAVLLESFYFFACNSPRLPHQLSPLTTAPLVGLRMTGVKCGRTLKSSRLLAPAMLPETASKEPGMRSPWSQLSSMNLTTDAVLSSLLLT